MENALRAMRHRGPDGMGAYYADPVALGHVRLAILDPANGAQPWVDSQSGVVLTYNGEIYNYRALREQLQTAGHQFRTDCDTEVLLAAYREWGWDCLTALRGIYAFALWDPAQRAVWLVRDRMGVKPLYYHTQARRCYFASSIAALRHLSGAALNQLDSVALVHYFQSIRTQLGAQTLFAGVRAVEPGQWVKLSASGTDVGSYWRVPNAPEAGEGAPDFDAQALEQVRAHLAASVCEQLVSDVPVGGFLSGGLDSSVLMSEVAAAAGRRLGTYSIGYARQGYNEWDAVAAAQAQLGVPCTRLDADESAYVADWERLIGEKGNVLSTPNEVPIRSLASAFRKVHTVALTGEGADEAFGGYVGVMASAIDYERLRGGQLQPNAFRAAYGLQLPQDAIAHYLQSNAWLGRPIQQALWGDWYAPQLHDRLGDVYRQHLAGGVGEGTTAQFEALLLRINLEGLLERLDSSTMSASVEGRVPFTDHRLIEWARALPAQWKFRMEGPPLSATQTARAAAANGACSSKRILRQAYAGRIAETVRTRPKASFPVPFLEAFQAEWKPLWRTALTDSPLLRQLLKPQLRDQISLPEASVNGMLAWPLLNLHLLEKQLGGLKLC